MLKLLLIVCIFFNHSVFSVTEKVFLLNFSKENMDRDNGVTLKRDKNFSSSKGDLSKLSFVIEAYPGPEKFKQIAAWCDQCVGDTFSDEQIKLCNDNIKTFYASFGGTPSDRNFDADLRKAEFGKSQFLEPDSKFKIRLSAGRLKCDSRGSGKRIRIDFFVK